MRGKNLGMKPEEIAEHYPRLFHMANIGSWPSIRLHGLLSTRALVDLYGIDGDLRERILRSRRAWTGLLSAISYRSGRKRSRNASPT